MTSLHCANCGSREIEPGESGATSQCRICGGQALVGVRSTALFGVVESRPPAAPKLTVITNHGVAPERAAALFGKIHAIIDAA